MRQFSSKLPAGIRHLFRLPPSRERLLHDMDEEMRIHVAMRAAELRAGGMSEADALVEAQRRFGCADDFYDHAKRRASQRARKHRVLEWLDEWQQDLRFATRQFRKNAAFTTLAVLTLALGIGANTAIFTVVHRLLLDPLPYRDGNRIVLLTVQDDDGGPSPVSSGAVSVWRVRAHSFQMIAGVSVDGIAVQDRAEQDTIPAYITSNYLSVLGIRPVIGRNLTIADERGENGNVAMITYGLWQRVYGGRPSAIGERANAAEGKSYTIVGVTPPEMGIPMTFDQPRPDKLHEATPSIWVPASLDSIGAGGEVFGLLRPGVSAAQASAEMQSIVDSVRVSVAGGLVARPASCCARALRAQDLVEPREARAIEVLFVAVGVLLLIACANVANLLMSRAWARRREFAVRTALGAGRGRLARLVLTESLLLALAGGLLGIAIAWETLRGIIALRPPALANLADIHLESTVLLWSTGVSIATGILFGAGPALLAGARSIGDVLRNETRARSGDNFSRRMRSGLIVAEIALSLVLLVGAGLLVRSFVTLLDTPLGFDPHNLIAADILLPPPRIMPREEKPAVERAILERVRAIPGITDAAIGTMPGAPYHEFGSFETDVASDGQSRSVPTLGVVFMTPSYFRVTQMSLRQGRLPDSTRWQQPLSMTDPAAPPIEVVINQTLAHRLWPNGRALGATFGSTGRGRRRSFTIVGVVNDVRMPGTSGDQPTVYQMPLAIEVPLVARFHGSSRDLAQTLRKTILATDSRTIPRAFTFGDDYVNDALAPTRFAMALLATFALVALVLSAVGLYGSISYSVGQRTREIGVRVALGADARAITGLVVGDGLRLAAAGALIGGIGATVATRTLTTMLYGVTASDPLTFAAIVVLVVGIALLAAYVPARRASRIDPTEALRAD